MTCEFLGTPTCPTLKAISTLKMGLGKSAEGFTPAELRELACKDNDPTIRQQGCPTFQSRNGLHKPR